eukprot:439406-Rhodomonas_salina.3
MCANAMNKPRECRLLYGSKDLVPKAVGYQVLGRPPVVVVWLVSVLRTAQRVRRTIGCEKAREGASWAGNAAKSKTKRNHLTYYTFPTRSPVLRLVASYTFPTRSPVLRPDSATHCQRDVRYYDRVGSCALPTRSPVLRLGSLLRACYTKPGTEPGYGGTRPVVFAEQQKASPGAQVDLHRRQPGTWPNQSQPASLSVQFVPGSQTLALDFAVSNLLSVYVMPGPAYAISSIELQIMPTHCPVLL